MVTIAVVAILATVGVPALQSLVQQNRVVSETNQLVTALNLARTEAVRRGEDVAVRPQGSEGISGGYCVLSSGSCDDDSIRSFAAMSRVQAVASLDNDNWIRFDSRGRKTAPTGSVEVTLTPDGCPSGTGERARVVTVSPSGLITTRSAACGT